MIRKTLLILVYIFVIPLFISAENNGALAYSADTLTININNNNLKQLYYSNYNIDSTQTHINRAIVVIHGSSRNADDYYEYVLYPAISHAVIAHTLIIAPKFTTEDDIVLLNLPDAFLFWGSSGWKQGDLSKDTPQHPRPVRISSFAIIDTILSRLVKNNPALTELVVVGHSAGGQFANRYAAGNQVEQYIQNQYNLPIICIIANPSSYLYFNGERRISGTLDQFVIPTNPPSDYDDYKYGLNNLNNYMSNPGGQQIISQYPQRNAVYLLGADDNDPNHSSLDTSPPAMLQGEHRLERGMIYYNYLAHFFSDTIYSTQKQAIVPGVGHSATDMFASNEGKLYLFDYVPTAIERIKSIPTGFFLEQNYPNPFNGTTHIPFSIAKRSRVRLDIFNILGQKVVGIIDEDLIADKYNLAWDGRNEIGNLVASGLYVYKLFSENKVLTRKLLLIK